MAALESHLQTFIIRVWLEEAAGKEKKAMWRGHITHIPSGERYHFQNLDDILHFMSRYLLSDATDG